jgi:metal-responsive CopG/Arc/MetJ family transcriptional regulator
MAATISGAETVDIPVPADIAERIDAIAVARHVSRDRAIADLLREAIAAYEQRRESFLELAGRFRDSTDPAETEQLRGELARMTFGD